MNSNSADYWIQHLHLQPHPEGGFYKEVFRSNLSVNRTNLPVGFKGNRQLTTSIYYLLRSKDISKFHRLKSDELWYYHFGSAIRIYIIDPEGKKHTEILGPNLYKAEQFNILIPSGNLFAAEIVTPEKFSLVSCVVSPGFDYEDFEMFEKDDLIQAYPKHAELFERFC